MSEITIEELLAEVDIERLVKEEIRIILKDKIQEMAKQIIETNITDYINTELALLMEKGIQINDGWGKEAKYESFETYFKKEFKEKVDSHYKIQTEIKRLVGEKLDKLTREASATLANLVLEGIKK